MKNNLKIALAAALLMGSVSVGAGAANAAGIGFSVGNVSIGYSDGYYDNSHHWHRWARHEDMQSWRTAHAEGYHDWRHDDKHHH